MSSAAQRPPRAKRLVIQAFSSTPKLPEGYETETWRKLESAVAAVYAREPVRESLEDLYKGVETLCLYHRAAWLYTTLRTYHDSRIRRMLPRLLSGVSGGGERVLEAVNAAWDDHCRCSLLIRSIFLFLDRTYALQTPGVHSLWDASLASFRAHVVGVPEVLPRVVGAVLGVVAAERAGEIVNKALASSVCQMLSALGLYETPMEPELVTASRAFYAAEARGRLAVASEGTLAEYLRLVERRLGEEAERCSSYLLPRSRKLLLGVVEKELFSDHLTTILGRGLAPMVTRFDAEARAGGDLGLLYRLCERVGAQAVGELRKEFSAILRASGKERVMNLDKEHERVMVQQLLDLKLRSDAMVSASFGKNQLFVAAVREAFEAFLNERPNKPAELIAKFVDRLLRAAKTAAAEDSTEPMIDRVVSLFRMVQGKDVFEAFYKKHLAKRLLEGKTGSVDLERSVISKLKSECGSAFTSKLEGMFKDIDVSRDITAVFRQQQSGAPTTGVEMTAFVLTSAYWPAFPRGTVELILPREISDMQDRFRTFYLAKYSGRKLQFQNGLGTVVLRALFSKGGTAARKEILVELPQATVLCLFGDLPEGTRLSFSDIAESTKLEPGLLKLVLLSLSAGPKFRVLTKTPKDSSISDSDTFAVDEAISNRLFRFTIPMLRAKEVGDADDSKTREAVQVDRQYQIDAAVVRIMKTRKTLSHTQLMNELVAQLRFPTQAADLKKRIESLIEREYLERDKDDPQIYTYLA